MENLSYKKHCKRILRQYGRHIKSYGDKVLGGSGRYDILKVGAE